MSQTNQLKDMIYAGLFAAFIAVMGWVAIPLPFSPVPITGQSLAVMLAGSLLTVRQAAFSVLTVILAGAVGAPVLAGGSGGLGVVIGPRGGYLLGFLIGVILIGLLKGSGQKLWRLALANFVGGIIAVYLPGMLWLSAVTGMSLQQALIAGVLPYLPGDLGKVVVATAAGAAVARRLRTAGAGALAGK